MNNKIVIAKCVLAVVLILVAAIAYADPHPHEPDLVIDKGEPVVEVINTNFATGGIGRGGEGGTGGDANNRIDIDDEKQAPGQALATSQDSFGFGITTVLGGIQFNLPWTWGDRKLLKTHAALIAAGNVDAADEVMCLTSPLKKLQKLQDKTHAECVTSLGKP